MLLSIGILELSAGYVVNEGLYSTLRFTFSKHAAEGIYWVFAVNNCGDGIFHAVIRQSFYAAINISGIYIADSTRSCCDSRANSPVGILNNSIVAREPEDFALCTKVIC